MLRIVLALILNGLTMRASAEIKFCNTYTEVVYAAVAFQNNGSWNSQGWIAVKPNTCTIDLTNASLTEFYYYAETAVLNGKYESWGKKNATARQFDVARTYFLFQNADRRRRGARFEWFNGPVDLGDASRLATLTFSDTGTTGTIAGAPSAGNGNGGGSPAGGGNEQPTGLSQAQLKLYNSLVANGRALLGAEYYVGPGATNAHPSAGVAELSFPITLSSLNNIQGSVVFRFYATPAEAAAYVAAGNNTPFVSESSADANGTNVTFGGTTRTAGTSLTIRTAYTVNDGLAWVRIAGQGMNSLDALGGPLATDTVVEIGTFKSPAQNGTFSQQTLDDLVDRFAFIYSGMLLGASNMSP